MKDKILKEFDEKFPALKGLVETQEIYGVNIGVALKEFISKALDEAVEAGIREGKSVRGYLMGYEAGKNEERQRMRDVLTGMKKTVDYEIDGTDAYKTEQLKKNPDHIYNQALYDAINKLT